MNSIHNQTKESLIEFEHQLSEDFIAGKINCPLHLSGGNEQELLEIFSLIKKEDYIFSTHRNHYHYLLKGGLKEDLYNEIRGYTWAINGGNARSMNIIDPAINFYSSAIVAGSCAIAVGVALAIKKDNKDNKGEKPHVYCFVGDGAEDSGHFFEAARFSESRQLPITFIIEDNDYACGVNKYQRWHNHSPITGTNIVRYNYKRTFPHVGVGKHVTF